MRPGARQNGQSFDSFNWSSLPVSEATLADAVGPYLLLAEIAERDNQNKVGGTLRRMLRLSDRTGLPQLMAAARAVPARQFPHLTAMVRQAYPDAEQSQRVKNAVTSVRRMMRIAAERDWIPIVLGADPSTPIVGPEWGNDSLSFFSDATRSSSVMRTYRRHWKRLATCCHELGIRCFDEVGTSDVDRVIEWFRRSARFRHATEVNRMIKWIGREYQRGPFRESPLVAPAYSLLPIPGGRATDTTDLVALLHDHGFTHPSWKKDLTYYWEYSSLPVAELRKRPAEFPARPSRRLLRAASLAQRNRALRSVLLVSLHRMPPGEELDPTSLTPSDVFGRLYPRLVEELLVVWEERHARGELEAAVGASLHASVGGSGLFAQALFERSLYLRGVRAPRNARGRSGVSFVVSNADLTAEESALHEAYALSCEFGNEIMDTLRELGPTTANHNVIKDIRRIMRETPPSFWITVHDQALQATWRGLGGVAEEFDTDAAPLRLLGDVPNDLRELVTMTYANGILLSAGLRLSELCHLRSDIHLTDRATREYRLRAVDRKNAKEHPFQLRARYVPHWLEAAYIELRGRLVAQDATDAHLFLLVDASGHPYGDQAEQADGSGRRLRVLIDRKSRLRVRWREFIARCAIAAKQPFPTQTGRLTPHEVRNVMGYAIVLERGYEMAAQWLGDEIESVRGHYSALDGAKLDSSFLAKSSVLGYDVAGARTNHGVPSAPSASSQGNHVTAPNNGAAMNTSPRNERANRLTQAWAEGRLTDAVFSHAMATLYDDNPP